MAMSARLLDAGTEIWDAQKNHPFVTELADGTLDDDAFIHWVKQDYRYLLDYARLFAIAGVKARDEATMRDLLGIAHSTLDTEMDLHREFAADYGISNRDLETTEKSPTCVAYTNYLVRTAYEGTLPEIAAALFPCMQGYLDIAKHMQDVSTETHRYTPFIELYTSDEFAEACAWCRDFVDDLGGRYPGEHGAMHAAFLRSAQLEYQFWEMAYIQETWGL